MTDTPYVTASEIGEFVYCKRGWWLRNNGKGVVTDAMIAGTKAHNKLFLMLRVHKKKVFAAASIFILGILLLILYFLLKGLV